MNLTGGIILYAVIWFMVFLIALPVRIRTQEEAGKGVVPGTPQSAPANPQVGKKAKIATLVAAVLWLIAAAVLIPGRVSIYDIDWFGRLGPEPAVSAP